MLIVYTVIYIRFHKVWTFSNISIFIKTLVPYNPVEMSRRQE